MTSSSTTSTLHRAELTNRRIRATVFTALFAALFIAGSFIKVPIGNLIPISMQSFAVMLAGGLLGATYGFWSIAIVVGLTACGIPLMNGAGGLAQILGPTGGFIWMFPISAFLIGFATDKLFTNRRKLGRNRQIVLLLTLFLFGSLLLYVTGVPWFMHEVPKYSNNLYSAMQAAMFSYLPGDAIKAVVATLVIAAIRPALPALRLTKKAAAKRPSKLVPH
ncbi:biotin transporter BioY [Cohnella faecalis]|uniref:Biotin transporter n=1 Tax=Cohnella faecalis TaxID=2315694 RepID=A0A398CVX2_9BACL|nr:biotin transporter BioY [Cohnella faecalis]RIE03361.1 biotin transporter BioY [Cohnella faecalis]